MLRSLVGSEMCIRDRLGVFGVEVNPDSGAEVTRKRDRVKDRSRRSYTFGDGGRADIIRKGAKQFEVNIQLGTETADFNFDTVDGVNGFESAFNYAMRTFAQQYIPEATDEGEATPQGPTVTQEGDADAGQTAQGEGRGSDEQTQPQEELPPFVNRSAVNAAKPQKLQYEKGTFNINISEGITESEGHEIIGIPESIVDSESQNNLPRLFVVKRGSKWQAYEYLTGRAMGNPGGNRREAFENALERLNTLPENFQDATRLLLTGDLSGFENCLLYTSPSPRDS